ncbi:MAG: GGDEF domain-containing protein [Solirubrobacteraceae bacterium]
MTIFWSVHAIRSRLGNAELQPSTRDSPDSNHPIASDPTPDAVLDAVAAILRALAETAAPDSECASQLQAWARHILILTPAPGATDVTPAERDWSGLSFHVVNHVRNDRETVSRSLGDLRDAVWMVVERLSHAVVGDATSDADAARQLERLRAAICSPAAELKATALETVEQLSAIIDEKSARQSQLARELGERVDILKSELEDTRREADIDPLTMVWNRGVFQRELSRAVQIHTLIDEPTCLALVDLDSFKQINDAHGHSAGDDALKMVAGALVRNFPRKSDVVTRLGGDEFAVILPGTAVEISVRLANRLLEAVRQLDVPGPREPVKLTVSVGIAEAFRAEPPDSWFARADRALYEAKNSGRDRVANARPPDAGSTPSQARGALLDTTTDGGKQPDAAAAGKRQADSQDERPVVSVR